MSTTTIHRAYNDVVASHYDRDPQGVIGRSLDLGIKQLQNSELFGPTKSSPQVLDVGMGTGLFLGKLKALSEGRVVPSGIDLAENMVENAQRRLPDLEAVVGDATRLSTYFPGQQFDCICTHFVTGYVPIRVLAPRSPPGSRSGVTGRSSAAPEAAYPAAAGEGDSKFMRWLSGAGVSKNG